jgi:hypothetical protein
VESEFDKLCEAVTEELESIPYDKLLERSKVVYRVPGVEKIGDDHRSKP